VDEGAVERFVHRGYAATVATVALVCGDRAAAEDAVLEAVARAWERLDRWKSIESLPAWVLAVSLNLSRSSFRRMLAEQRARLRLSPPIVADPIESLAYVDVLRGLDRLSRREREVTVLRYYRDLDVAEIASVLGIGDGTVKVLLHRARAKLAAVLGTPESESESEAETSGRV
jgi:RNA polymerase sigma-70 factor (ECF subfamily)